MRTWVGGTFLGVAIGLAGCAGSASFVLRAPVADQCTKAGLKGCDELTEGAILFVEGKKEAGKAKALAGARKNSPEELKRYVTLLRATKELPGVSDHVAPILEFADLILEETGTEGAIVPRSAIAVTNNGATSHGTAGASVKATVTNEKWSRLRDGVVSTPIASMKVCERAWGPGARCEAVAWGPLVLSDLESLGTDCRGQFVAILPDNIPRFRLEGPFSTPGARYVLGDKDVLLVGQTASPLHTETNEKNPKASKDELSLDEEDPRYSCKLYFSGEIL